MQPVKEYENGHLVIREVDVKNDHIDCALLRPDEAGISVGLSLQEWFDLPLAVDEQNFEQDILDEAYLLSEFKNENIQEAFRRILSGLIKTVIWTGEADWSNLSDEDAVDLILSETKKNAPK